MASVRESLSSKCTFFKIDVCFFPLSRIPGVFFFNPTRRMYEVCFFFNPTRHLHPVCVVFNLTRPMRPVCVVFNFTRYMCPVCVVFNSTRYICPVYVISILLGTECTVAAPSGVCIKSNLDFSNVKF